MTFFLVKEQKFELSSENKYHGLPDIHCLRTFTVPSFVQPAADGSLTEKECARLRAMLENGEEKNQLVESEVRSGEKGKRRDEYLNWNLDVFIYIISDSNNNNRDYIRVTEAGKEGVLKRLKNFQEKHGLNLKIVIKLHKFTSRQTVYRRTVQTVDHVWSMESDLEQISSSNGAQLTFSGYWNRAFWDPFSHCVYDGALTIQCFLYPAAFTFNAILAQVKPTVNQKILEENLNCDVAIIAKDDITIKCHKSFLSAQSTVFQAMFKGENFMESKTNTIEMPDMTEDGVNALLAYLYLSEDDKADKDSSIAFELLQAGHKYDISSLEESMELILLTKPDEWYHIDVVVKLFLFARNLPLGNRLKMRAINLLNTNIDGTKASSTYKKLLESQPEAAKELCEHVLNAL